MKKVSYDVLDLHTRSLFHQINNQDFKIDIIIAIGRGGWLPAMIFTDMLKKRKVDYELLSIVLSNYVDKKRKSTRVIHDLTYQNINYLQRRSDKNILILDDISDTGKSLIWVVNRLQIKGEPRLKTATVYIKPHTRLIPDFYTKEIPNDVWVLFPHEKEEFS